VIGAAKRAVIVLGIASLAAGAVAWGMLRSLERELASVAVQRAELILHRLAAEFAEARARGLRPHRLVEVFGDPSHEVRAVRVLSPEAVVVRASATNEIGRRLDVGTVVERWADLTWTTAPGPPRVVRLARPISNEPRCAPCHDPLAPILGFLSLDLTFDHAERALAPFRLLAGAAGAMVGLSALLLLGFVWFEARSGPARGRLPVQEDRPRTEATHPAQMLRAGRLAAVGELASSIAHEVKTPLAGIGAAMQVLARGFLDGDPRREMSEEILREVKRLQHVLRGLLDVACVPARPVTADIHEPLAKVLFLLRPVARDQGTALIERLADGLPAVRVDAKRIQQVLLNIVMNALQAVGRGGEVTVSTALAPERWLEVSVRDDGPGIPVHDQRRIFEPFYTTKREGTGLGLTVAREIVASHGGELLVVSGPGRGTTFTIRLRAEPGS
jgi:signal transduction histidine kinase